MKKRILGVLKIGLFIFGFLVLYASANGVNIEGKVFTLPVSIGGEGPEFTLVAGMPVVFNEDQDHTGISDENGIYNIPLSSDLEGALYTLRLDDNINILQEDVYLPSYTIPTFFYGGIDNQDVMVLSSTQLADLGVSLTSGKGALIVITSSENDMITGATAVVRNMNSSSVGTVKYLAFDSESTYGLTLKDSPVDDNVEEGGTFGFVAYNIDPGVVMVSATKTGYSFLWRPAFIYADSITTGVSRYDDIIGWQGSYVIEEATGYLVDETGSPVSGATITICGMNKSATTQEDGSFTFTNIPYPAFVIVRARKTGYKDTYTYALISEGEEPQSLNLCMLQLDDEDDDEENPTFMIISSACAERFGIDFTNGGVITGRINDNDGNPVKNAKVYVWDEYGDTPALLARYVDCMMETIDDELERTSDSGIFVLDTVEEVASQGISTTGPVYFKFEHEDTSGNTYYFSPHYIAPIFNNSITLFPDMEMDEYIGRVDVSGQPETLLVEPGAAGVDLFYMKLELPEEYISQLQSSSYLKSFTLKCEGTTLPTQVAVYIKAGEDWESVSCVVNMGNNEMLFNITEEITLPVEILVQGNFAVGNSGSLNLSAPYFYCELEKNCDVEVINTVSEIPLAGEELYVSVSGAPVEGNTIYIKTEEPSIAVDPEEIDFGDVKVGASETRTIAIYNTSQQVVQVISSVEGTDADEFSEAVTPVSVINIEVGEMAYLEVTFTPASTGDKSATLRLSYTGLGAANGEDVLVPLSGTGVSDGGGGGGGEGGGCFIATAAFGSPLHHCVNILREFRDMYLLKNSAGRAFVRWYYIHSPRYARIIAESKILKLLTRVALLPLIGITYLIVKGIFSYFVFGLGLLALVRIKR